MKLHTIIYGFLSFLMILYIVLGVHTPVIITQGMYSGIGPILMLIFIIYIFYNYDIYLTLLSILACSMLVVRTNNSFITNIPGMTKPQQYQFYNTVTDDKLETDMVKTRVPNSNFNETSNDMFGEDVSPSDVETTLPIYSII